MARNEYKCDCNSINQEIAFKGKSIIEKWDMHNRLKEFYKPFADSTRLRILYLLDNLGEMCVCDIAVALNMTKSAISHQLNFLKDNKLVGSNKIGKLVKYSIADDHVKDILEKGIEHLLEEV